MSTYIDAKFNDEIIPSDGSYSLVEPGDYSATIKKVEDGKSKAGNEMLTVTFEITGFEAEDAGKCFEVGKTIRNWYPYGTDFGLKRMLHLVKVTEIPVDKKGGFDADGMIDKEIAFTVTHEAGKRPTPDGGMEDTINARVSRERSLYEEEEEEEAPPPPATNSKRRKATPQPRA